MIKAVLFDFDDTLHDYDVTFNIYLDRLFAKYFTYVPDGARETLTKLIDRGYYYRMPFFEYIADNYPVHDYDAKQAFDDFEVDLPRSIVLMDGAVETVQKIRDMGYLTGIVTVGPSFLQNYKLVLTGIKTLMNDTIVSGDIHYRKPAKEAFELAARRLDVKCEECIFVGDHPVNDMQGSHEAGMQCVYMNKLGNVKIPYATEITDIRQLPAVVAQIAQKTK